MKKKHAWQKGISIVIPAYNEEKRLSSTLDLISKYLKEGKVKHEIIVVNDGSTDRTTDVARKHGATVISFKKNQGKGWAVRHGMLKAKHSWILMADADNSTPIKMLERMNPKDNEILIASRNLPESKRPVKQGIIRLFLGQAFPIMVRITLLPGIRDCQCGFKLFPKKAAKKIFNKCLLDRFGFDAEALYIARKLGYKVREVPVEWHNDPDSRFHPIKDSIRTGFDIFKIRKNSLTGKYK